MNFNLAGRANNNTYLAIFSIQFQNLKNVYFYFKIQSISTSDIRTNRRQYGASNTVVSCKLHWYQEQFSFWSDKQRDSVPSNFFSSDSTRKNNRPLLSWIQKIYYFIMDHLVSHFTSSVSWTMSIRMFMLPVLFFIIFYLSRSHFVAV